MSNDPYATTPHFVEKVEPTGDSVTPNLPASIGRYRVERVLGEGGFGRVYLAHDDQLSRRVAIKVPHPKRITGPDDAQAYLAEARTVAGLNHPHIVAVHDCGSTPEFPVYVVSMYIEGTDVAGRLRHGPLAPAQAAELVAVVAEALHYAHKRGLVHRDVKPANILLDSAGTPYVVDFGLALREEQIGQGPHYAGTPAYMSPEQARGEGHRVDGRSDVFSLGIVLYELLAGRRPFPGQSTQEFLNQICTLEPRPPRQLDETIPKELERICLKALAKRAVDRYTTAHDMADDLRQFLAELSPRKRNAGPAPSTQAGPTAAETSALRDVPVTPSDSLSVKIVPKGLRSFDAHDADFFLELLPGPRDRQGLPDSLRFWKTRIEETDAEATFSVGLIYGPSGCGKSSLVKAGLLPRLSDRVLSVYIEATPDDTETRLLNGLRKRCPALPEHLNLKDSMAALRCGQGLPPGMKALLVLDQFEQWLHARRDEQNTELVQALRQCDGGRVQCIVMVRDDFWLAVSRFLRELEVDLIQGRNSALADLFDADHARKVLAAFGRAYGRLGEQARIWSADEQSFLDEAIVGLTEEGKVVSVRLALFAEMMKSKPWTPASLKEAGGAQGVGVAFLEETFSARSAPPGHRYHQQAARAVVNSLLPEAGTQIKGNLRSQDELLAASGYAGRPRDFEELLRILDGALRLITPTDPEGSEKSTAETADPTPHLYYQLTHDYLVPALRDWLTRKQRETRRGRAELRLEERSTLWNARPENRRLPALWEDLNIRLFTRKKYWTDAQCKMMRKAAASHGLRMGIVTAVLAIVVTFGVSVRNNLVAENDRKRAETLVEAVLTAPAEAVPYAIANLQPLEAVAVPILKSRFAEADRDRTQRLHAVCALAHFGHFEHDYLTESIEWTATGECPNLVTALRHNSASALGKLKQSFAAEQQPALRVRLAITLLHLGDIGAAQADLAIGPDPSQRTAFIHGLETWHADPADLVEPLRATQDSAFRSGLILAFGRISPAGKAAAKQALAGVLLELYQQAPDGATHSATGWTLRQWEVELPKLAVGQISKVPVAKRGWFVNSQGQTMIEIPAGSFTRKDQIENANEQIVTLTRAFHLSDREISVAEFQQFVDDAACPAAEKPQQWPGANKSFSLTGAHPVQQVSWYDAVLYCNWLSRKHGLTSCYERTGGKEKSAFEKDAQGQPVEHDAWRLVERTTGYRLPTEAEWEHACRAGTTTQFGHGDEESLLAAYAVYLKSKSQPCGGKLPNAWGLFDMHGNVWEWCHDGYADYATADHVEDPFVASEGSSRLARGGDWSDTGGDCRSAYRFWDSPSVRGEYLGFRVAAMPLLNK